jgi:hypothetical protein
MIAWSRPSIVGALAAEFGVDLLAAGHPRSAVQFPADGVAS